MLASFYRCENKGQKNAVFVQGVPTQKQQIWDLSTYLPKPRAIMLFFPLLLPPHSEKTDKILNIQDQIE